MPFLHTEDHTSLAYDDWGSGPSVVFVHGWVLGADAWEYQTSMLSEQGFRCVAYDRRGCGRSDRPGTGYDFDTLADDLAALIEHLDLSEVTLVGHSMGCGDIARYLTRHGPSRIARAALIAPTTPFLLQTPDNPEGVDASVFDFMVSQLVADRPQFLALAAPSFFGQAFTPELLQWGVGLALRSPLKPTIDMVRTFSQTDLRADMASFTVPTLVVHGDADQAAPIDLCGRRTAEAVPDGRLEVYEGAPHGLFLTEKDRLNEDLLKFAMS